MESEVRLFIVCCILILWFSLNIKKISNPSSIYYKVAIKTI